ncbi:hypothetical protein [Mycobacterium sp. SA01]|uniref:hypothetical protein n=1 Tax=Mycobacterium sp. SA01 TaxID=3238820 RepID=UPI00351B2F45
MSETNSLSVSAGERLRAEMDAALRRASEELGQPADQPLEWTEQEAAALEAACAAADRAEALQVVFDTEKAGENRPMLLVKVSAELRALDRQVVDLLGKVNPGIGAAVSPRHQKAARGRWGVAR